MICGASAMRAKEPTNDAAEWGGKAPNFAILWEMAKDPYLESTHFRNSVLSDFRRNFGRVGYEANRATKNAAFGGGEALFFRHL